MEIYHNITLQLYPVSNYRPHCSLKDEHAHFRLQVMKEVKCSKELECRLIGTCKIERFALKLTNIYEFPCVYFRRIGYLIV